MTKSIKLVISIAARAVLSAAILAPMIVFLVAREYFRSLRSVDNLLGALPILLLLLLAVSAVSLIWLIPIDKKVLRERAAPLVALGLCAAISLGLFFPSVRGHWWRYENGASSDNFDYSPYYPFGRGGKTVVLSDESTLHMDTLLRLDGGKDKFPIYSAIVGAVWNEEFYDNNPSLLVCRNTPSAYEALISGENDIIFVVGPSASQLALAKSAGVEIVFTPIGKEAFVFLVGAENPVDSLSLQQIRDIYSGKTAKWGTVGWRGGGEILAFQRPDGSGSQSALQKLMGGLPIMYPRPKPSGLIESDSLMEQLGARYKGVQSGLGFSYRYFATEMYPNPDVRPIAINGVEPTKENIKNGSYPLVIEFFAATIGEPTGAARELIDWVLGPQGQWIIEQVGYVGIG